VKSNNTDPVACFNKGGDMMRSGWLSQGVIHHPHYHFIAMKDFYRITLRYTLAGLCRDYGPVGLFLPDPMVYEDIFFHAHLQAKRAQSAICYSALLNLPFFCC
jgi:hypothetical protein